MLTILRNYVQKMHRQGMHLRSLLTTPSGISQGADPGMSLVSFNGLLLLAGWDDFPGSLCHSPQVDICIGCVDKIFNLDDNCETIRERTFRFDIFLVTRPFTKCHTVLPCDLDRSLNYFWKTLILAITFQSEQVAFVLHMLFIVIMASVEYLILWPWSLTYSWGYLMLAIASKPDAKGLSNCTCIFIVARTFTSYNNLDPVTLTFDLVLKNCNIGHNVHTRR